MSISIETTKLDNRFVISVPADQISAEEIEEIVTALKTEFILRRSEMSGNDAEIISEEIKSEWWAKNAFRIQNSV
jgi:hypothetical protein